MRGARVRVHQLEPSRSAACDGHGCTWRERNIEVKELRMTIAFKARIIHDLWHACGQKHWLGKTDVRGPKAFEFWRTDSVLGCTTDLHMNALVCIHT